jgi:transcriptional regulator GlxA family with amidase domain
VEIDILPFKDVEELDLAGPYEVLGKLTEFVDDVSLQVVAHTPTICCRHGLCIERTRSLKELPGDILVVPGGKGVRTPSKERTAVIKYIAHSYPSRKYLLSVCTGTFLLTEARILSEKTVTTHRSYLAHLEGVTVVDHRIVKDGNLITCQGVSSGIDASLFLVSLLYGKDVAQKIIERIEYVLSIEEIYSMVHTVR